VSCARNAPRGRFESGNAAEVRGQSDAPAEIAANVEKGSTGGEDRDEMLKALEHWQGDMETPEEDW